MATATPPGSARRPLALALSLLVLVLFAPLGWYIWTSVLRPTDFNGMEIQAARPVADFALTNADGRSLRLADLRGKVVVLYFGYTFCPDACPMTLSKLAQARTLIGGPARDVQVMMVTVDPERDTSDILQHYVTRFDPSFVGLTGRPEEIAAAASAFGIYYQKNEGSAATGYLVDHTATALVVDRQGRLRLVLPPDLDATEIASDLKTLLSRS